MAIVIIVKVIEVNSKIVKVNGAWAAEDDGNSLSLHPSVSLRSKEEHQEKKTVPKTASAWQKMPKPQDSNYTRKGEDAKCWGSTAMFLPHTSASGFVARPITRGTEARARGSWPWTNDPQPLPEKDLAHLNLLRSVLVTRGTQRAHWRGIFKMSNFQGRDENARRGETGHWRYSGRGKARGSLSSSSTNPPKNQKKHNILSTPPHIFIPPKKIHWGTWTLLYGKTRYC